MSAACKAWAVAASVAAVEALKDQGICRWSYIFRSLHRQAKTNLKSRVQDANGMTPHANRITPQSTAAAAANKARNLKKLKRSEESLRTVMYLSTWGPS